MTSAITPRIDDYLGDPADRYFGDGFRRVGRRLGPLRTTDEPGVVRAAAAFTYPDTWSVKSASPTLVPHLSSIDALVVSSTAATAALSSALDVSTDRLRVTRVSMSAGSSPVEDLAAIPLELRLDSVSAGSSTSIVPFTLASMRGSVTISHPRVEEIQHRRGAVSVPRIDDRPEFSTRVDVTDVDVSVPGAVTGTALVTAPPAVEMSMLDALVGSAQLAQILLYELDDIDRSTSDTLWMRRLTLAADEPRTAPTGESFTAAVVARRTSVVTMGGQPWRSADLELTRFGGLTAQCRVAHRLPGGAS